MRALHVGPRVLKPSSSAWGIVDSSAEHVKWRHILKCLCWGYSQCVSGLILALYSETSECVATASCSGMRVQCILNRILSSFLCHVVFREITLMPLVWSAGTRVIKSGETRAMNPSTLSCSRARLSAQYICLVNARVSPCEHLLKTHLSHAATRMLRHEALVHVKRHRLDPFRDGIGHQLNVFS